MSTVEIRQGDILNSQAQTLVNTVNCVGVMGKGIALAFKRRFPTMFAEYSAKCSRGEVKLGQPYLYRGLDHWVLNFPTKEHWRGVSRLDDIVRGLEHLKSNCSAWNITSIAMPPLGCGNGELDWRVVGPILLRYLEDLDIPAELFAPRETPPGQVALPLLESTLDGPIEPAWVALAEIVAAINRERYHTPVGRVMLQKIGYFATVSGLPTKLSFEAASYGPWSRGLKPAISKLVNNGILREEGSEGRFRYVPGTGYNEALVAWSHSVRAWQNAIDRTTDLFMRIRTTRQAEVAATIHFVVDQLQWAGQAPDERAVFNEVKRWKERRDPPLRDEELAEAIRSLNVLGWLRVTPSDDLPVWDEDLALA
jgi:O-acetyl-ADP-ribose deacetylase (regulator of RNase III)/uncharacterized protein YwgA